MERAEREEKRREEKGEERTSGGTTWERLSMSCLSKRASSSIDRHMCPFTHIPTTIMKRRKKHKENWNETRPWSFVLCVMKFFFPLLSMRLREEDIEGVSWLLIIVACCFLMVAMLYFFHVCVRVSVPFLLAAAVPPPLREENQGKTRPIL